MIRLARRTLIAALTLWALPLAAQDAALQVSITEAGYAPAALRAQAGDRIRFVNEHDRAHTATADDASFDTGRIRPGESATVTVQGPTGFGDRFNPRFRGTIAP